MAIRPANYGTEWSGEDIEKLRALAAENFPLRFIASKLGRTERTIQRKAAELGISLKPANKRRAIGRAAPIQ
jgi:hypothetical protein